MTTSCVYTRPPCVCVYSAGDRVGEPLAAKQQTATRRRVCEDTHTSRTSSRSFVLFCKGASLHTQHTGSVCRVCVRSEVV